MLAIYCRISQEKEEGKDRSIEYQKKIGVELAKELGINYKVYIDDGISGTWEIEKRPDFSRMLTDVVKKGSKITAIYGYDRFRLSRNDEVRIQFLSICRKHNVKIYHEKTEYDWDDPTAKLLDTVLSAMGEFYVDITKKHVKGVLKSRALKEKVHGVMPYGYTRDENEKMVPHPEESKVIKDIFNWSLNGMGYNSIANRLNEMEVPTRYNTYKGTFEVDSNRNNALKEKNYVERQKADCKWGNATIGRILHNEVYTGIRRYGDVSFPIPPLIDKTVFNKVRKRIKDRLKKSGKKSDHNYLLNDLVFCGRCGNRYTGREVSGKKYYRCTSRIVKGGSCGNSGIRMEKLDLFLWERFFKSRELVRLVEAYIKDSDTEGRKASITQEIQALEKSIASLGRDRAYAIRLTVKRVLPESDIKGELERIDGLIKENQSKISNLDEQLESYRTSNERLQLMGTDFEGIEAVTGFNAKQELFRKYVERVSIESNGGWYDIALSFKVKDMESEHYVMDKGYTMAVKIGDNAGTILLDGSPQYKEDDVVYLVHRDTEG